MTRPFIVSRLRSIGEVRSSGPGVSRSFCARTGSTVRNVIAGA